MGWSTPVALNKDDGTFNMLPTDRMWGSYFADNGLSQDAGATKSTLQTWASNNYSGDNYTGAGEAAGAAIPRDQAISAEAAKLIKDKGIVSIQTNPDGFAKGKAGIRFLDAQGNVVGESTYDKSNTNQRAAIAFALVASAGLAAGALGAGAAAGAGGAGAGTGAAAGAAGAAGVDAASLGSLGLSGVGGGAGAAGAAGTAGAVGGSGLTLGGVTAGGAGGAGGIGGTLGSTVGAGSALGGLGGGGATAAGTTAATTAGGGGLMSSIGSALGGGSTGSVWGDLALKVGGPMLTSLIGGNATSNALKSGTKSAQRNAAALNDIAGKQVALGDKAYADSMALFEQYKPMLNELIGTNLQAQKDSLARAGSEWADYEATWKPLQQQYAQSARDFASPERVAQEDMRARSGASEQYDLAQQERTRQLQMSGADASTIAALNASGRLEAAKGIAGAGSDARLQREASGINVLGGAANFGRSIPSTSLGLSQLANQQGASAQGAIAGSMDSIIRPAAVAGSLYGSAGNTLNGAAQLDMQAALAKAGLYQGITQDVTGALGGLAGMYFGNNKTTLPTTTQP
ncbi:MAG: hypothetical protein ABIO71_07900 [Caldimonas sp.]